MVLGVVIGGEVVVEIVGLQPEGGVADVVGVFSVGLEFELPVSEVEIGYHFFGVGLGCPVDGFHYNLAGGFIKL